MGGVVYWAHRISGDTFTAFSPVYPSFNRAHSQVTAIARGPDQIDLFVTTFEGEVFTTAWDKVKNDWSAWSRIDSSFSKSIYSNTMAAVSRSDEIVELFVTGNDGFVYQARRDGTMPWSGFVPVPEDGSFATAGSQVAAISRDVDHIDLFVMGFNNRVYNNSWETGRGWVSWQILDGFVAPDVTPNRPPITVVARKSERLDVFVATKGGSVHSTTWDSTIGWLGWWRWIDAEFAGSGDAVSALWRTPDRLELFDASYDAGQDGAVYCTYWDPTPGLLRRATINFHTHDDDKDSASVVHVFVKTRLSNSLTPESDTDYLTNLFGMQRYQPGGELSFGKRNPYLASGEYLGAGVTFDDPGDMTYELDLAATDITVNDVILPEVDICFLTDQGAIFGDDTWIFDYTVSLHFDDGILSFSSTDTGGAGIISRKASSRIQASVSKITCALNHFSKPRQRTPTPY